MLKSLGERQPLRYPRQVKMNLNNETYIALQDAANKAGITVSAQARKQLEYSFSLPSSGVDPVMRELELLQLLVQSVKTLQVTLADQHLMKERLAQAEASAKDRLKGFRERMGK